MSAEEDVAHFIAAAKSAANINALQALVEATIKKLGFDYFALIHHASLYATGSGMVFLHNYPEAWAATIFVRDYLLDDPLAELCRRQNAPFLWSDMPVLIDMSQRQREIMREARKNGLANGYTVPIHMTGEPVGSCSFSVRGELPMASLPAAVSVGINAFEFARRLVRRGAAPPLAVTRRRLTPRERDCLVLVARGASDREASQVLGIPEAHVTRHIEQARKKLDAASRLDLVARALYRSELRFDELVEVENEPSGIALARRNRVVAEEPLPMLRLGALFFGDNPELN